jgi:hypothetical protein
MLAIVLTCDRYRALTEHMIHCYNDVWSRHPFLFCVPYQAVNGTNSSNSRYVRTPPRIKETVLNLLMDLEDEQWVYWCIDDKYPMQLELDRIESIVDWLSSELSGEDISGLLFCRCRSLLHSDNLTWNRRISKSGEVLLERRAYHQIWIHEFPRVKVLLYFSVISGWNKFSKNYGHAAMERPKASFASVVCHQRQSCYIRRKHVAWRN